MKVLLSDYDNTLYFKDEGGLREGDIQAISEFQQKGNLFGICSGRPYFGMRHNLKGINPDFFVQCSGALILDNKENIIYGKPIDNAVVELVRHYQEFTLVMFGVKGIYMTSPIPGMKSIDDYDESDDQIYGISLVCRSVEDAQFYHNEINQLDLVDAYVNVNSVDIVSAGCSKKQGVQAIEEYLDSKNKGIEVETIGDSYNDVPMLEYTPISFTFNNSPDDVKKCATYCVDSVAQAIDILSL